MKNRRGEVGNVVFGLVIISCIFTSTIIGGCCIGTATERKNAIDAHVGRWEIDAVSGEREFVYGTEKE